MARPPKPGIRCATLAVIQVTEDPRQRAHRLLQRWGWNATSFQTLSEGFSYWFTHEGCVAYAACGGAWVGAGAPIADSDRLSQVANGFVEAAAARGKRASFFAVEQRFLRATKMSSFLVGEQPVYDPGVWCTHLRRSASLREQLRRARAKGVHVSPGVPVDDANELARVHEAWLSRHALPGMGFLTGLDPFSEERPRRYFVARSRENRIEGFAALSPVYARQGWLFEHLVRSPSAPNGTVELLVDAAMRALADDGVAWATLGLAPLAGDVALPLKWVRRWAEPLYNFEGLRAFKAKLGPVRWDPVYLAYPRTNNGLTALCDGLAAFTRGRPLGFATRSLSKSLMRSS
ncbi:MAG TPA: phosphatidylglycerol lysyltransferase domain-containing protein [Polyangiaceae bacterium]|nr:phosphatidylglycerol lysyltransferase domain-containing protein [Polyangiaceae bacterium]